MARARLKYALGGLLCAAAVVGGPLSVAKATSGTDASYAPQNVVVGIGYYSDLGGSAPMQGCNIQVQHGQYGTAAYSQVRVMSSTSGCTAYTRVHVAGLTPAGTQVTATDSTWKQSLRANATFTWVSYGIQLQNGALLDIEFNSAGQLQYSDEYCYGECSW